MALPLEQAHDAPFWVRQLPAFVHERRGEMGDARHIIEEIEANTKDIPRAGAEVHAVFRGGAHEKAGIAAEG